MLEYYLGLGAYVAVCVMLSATVVAVALAFVRRRNALLGLRLQSLHIVPVALICAALGALRVCGCWPVAAEEAAADGGVVHGTISKLSIDDNTTRITLEPRLSHLGKIQLSVDGTSHLMQEGSDIAFRAHLRPVRNLGNPFEFNYVRHLHSEGIFYSQRLDVDSVAVIGINHSVYYQLRRVRNRIKLSVLYSSLQPETQRFILATLLGASDMIDSDSREEFSQAGVAHILALSGLHIGIIMLLLWWLLLPLDYLRYGKSVRLGVTVAVVMFYAVFTGLSASVVRSALMISVAIVASMSHRKNSSLNGLLAAALIILAVNPLAVFGIGFQLSFVTVASFIVAFSKFGDVMRCLRQPLGYICTSLLSSLVAMLATSLITAYFFHTISFVSFISNLVILLILPAFMMIAILQIFTLCTVGEVSVVSRVTDWGSDSIYGLTRAIASMGISHSNGIYVSLATVLLFYVALLLVCLCFFYKKKVLLVAAVCAVVATVVSARLTYTSVPSEGLYILNSYNGTPILYCRGRMAALYCPDCDVSLDDFKKQYNGVLSYHRIKRIRIVKDMAGLGGGCAFDTTHATLLGKSYAVARRQQWKRLDAKHKIDVDYLIVTRTCNAKTEELLAIYAPKCVVLSGGIYDVKACQYSRGLRHYGQFVYDIGAVGALCQR